MYTDATLSVVRLMNIFEVTPTPHSGINVKKWNSINYTFLISWSIHSHLLQGLFNKFIRLILINWCHVCCFTVSISRSREEHWSGHGGWVVAVRGSSGRHAQWPAACPRVAGAAPSWDTAWGHTWGETAWILAQIQAPCCWRCLQSDLPAVWFPEVLTPLFFPMTAHAWLLPRWWPWRKPTLGMSVTLKASCNNKSEVENHTLWCSWVISGEARERACDLLGPRPRELFLTPNKLPFLVWLDHRNASCRAGRGSWLQLWIPPHTAHLYN